MGWAAEKPARLREVAKLSADLEADIRSLHGLPLAAPLLHNLAAHKWLGVWVPEIVERILNGA